MSFGAAKNESDGHFCFFFGQKTANYLNSTIMINIKTKQKKDISLSSGIFKFSFLNFLLFVFFFKESSGEN